jgi:deoxyribodipyrimidine photo-lyase
MCHKIVPVFIFTPEQVTGANDYKSKNAVQFMLESLDDLSKEISKMGGKLHCFYGKNKTIIQELIKELEIDYLCFNADCTPYAFQRDFEIMKLCQEKNVHAEYAHDYYLHPLGTILNTSGKHYQKFTPFYENCLKKQVLSPVGMRKIHFYNFSKQLSHEITLKVALEKFVGTTNPNISVNGGRENGLKALRSATKTQSHYGKTRDTLAIKTSLLSAYTKFGCVSIREVHKAFKGNREFIRQLFWRDFYAQLLLNEPHVLGRAMYPKYNKIQWHHNERWFNCWKTGTTGFPIVDASQRQLLQTGWTHNRGRMISSSVLVKIFLIDWRKGEQFYAQHLTDYDVASNNGGWQSSAGTGADSQAYWRFFNPWSQSKQHDPECEYIKTWIPELKDVPNNAIHNWDKEWTNYKEVNYSKPICVYEEQKEKSLKMYKSALYS